MWGRPPAALLMWAATQNFAEGYYLMAELLPRQGAGPKCSALGGSDTNR